MIDAPLAEFPGHGLGDCSDIVRIGVSDQAVEPCPHQAASEGAVGLTLDPSTSDLLGILKAAAVLLANESIRIGLDWLPGLARLRRGHLAAHVGAVCGAGGET